MKIEITEQKDNLLLSRKEIKGVLTFDKSTPSNMDLEAALAKQFNVEKACVRAKKISTHYGQTKADFLVFIYDSKEALEKVEPAPKKWLEKLQKAEEVKKKAEESKAAEAEKEAPAEEKKEEPKPEEKKAESEKEGAE